jgi:hypothetical protein
MTHGEGPTDDRLFPVLMAVTYLAALIASWGLISLVTNTDVITEPDAGPLLGPAMAAAATIVTWILLARVRSSRSILGLAALAAVSTWFAMIVVGGIGYSVTKGDFTWLLLFGGKYAVSPFVVIPALLAALAVVLTKLLTGRSPRAKSFDRR